MSIGTVITTMPVPFFPEEILNESEAIISVYNKRKKVPLDMEVYLYGIDQLDTVVVKVIPLRDVFTFKLQYISGARLLVNLSVILVNS